MRTAPKENGEWIQYGNVLHVEGAFCERAEMVIPEIHDQWAASLAGALSAHESATQPVGQRAGEIDAIPVTSNCQKMCLMGGKTVMANYTDILFVDAGRNTLIASRRRTRNSGDFVILYGHHH